MTDCRKPKGFIWEDKGSFIYRYGIDMDSTSLPTQRYLTSAVQGISSQWPPEKYRMRLVEASVSENQVELNDGTSVSMDRLELVLKVSPLFKVSSPVTPPTKGEIT